MRQAKGGAFFKGRRAWNSGELDPEESHGVRGQAMHAFQPWLGAVEEGRYPVYCRTGLHYDDAGLGEENGGWAASPGGRNASRPPWTPCLRVTHRYMPMLTPAEVPAEYLSHINPVEVATVCSGECMLQACASSLEAPCSWAGGCRVASWGINMALP